MLNPSLEKPFHAILKVSSTFPEGWNKGESVFEPIFIQKGDNEQLASNKTRLVHYKNKLKWNVCLGICCVQIESVIADENPTRRKHVAPPRNGICDCGGQSHECRKNVQVRKRVGCLQEYQGNKKAAYLID